MAFLQNLTLVGKNFQDILSLDTNNIVHCGFATNLAALA